MIKITLIVKPDCVACGIAKKVIIRALNDINCEITFKVINHTDDIDKLYNIKKYPTTIFEKVDIKNNVIKSTREIGRLVGSFPIDYLKGVIDKLKIE